MRDRLRTIIRSGALILWVGLICPATIQAQETIRAGTFRNPIKQQGADPWLFWHGGSYYLATTTGDNLQLRQARSLAELKSAADRLIWEDKTPERSRFMWAPEFHRLDAGDGSGHRWYLYYTATDAQGTDANHRMFVLQSAGDDPMGPYAFKAQLQTDRDDRYYAIDGTVLTMPDNQRYFVWCGRPSAVGQSLYIARMANPWTLSGDRVAIEADGFGCDVVREGPVALRQDNQGRVFLIYSTCPADTPDYKLGMLSIDPAGDPMDPAAWRQHPGPVFTRNDDARVYGPGHNGFFRSPDGREHWIIYHAKSSTRKTYADRSARAQPFTWNDDGTPNFGKPLPVETDLPEPSGTMNQ